MDPDFVHLHVHSCYSMMRGANSPKALCREAKSAGFTHLALTDTNGFYGLINFLEAARESGIEPIVGTAVNDGMHSAVILARTPKGFEILSGLVTGRHVRKDFSLLADLPEKKGDIIVLCSKPELARELRNRFECYLEVVPGPGDRKLLEASRSLGIAPVATNAVHFAREADYP
ncbi:MAG: PHP domain-containing protein, partial [Syntrophobacteraceae bacterium]